MTGYWKVGDYGKELRWNKPSLYFKVVAIVNPDKGITMAHSMQLIDECGTQHPYYMCEKTDEEHYMLGQY